MEPCFFSPEGSAARLPAALRQHERHGHAAPVVALEAQQRVPLQLRLRELGQEAVRLARVDSVGSRLNAQRQWDQRLRRRLARAAPEAVAGRPVGRPLYPPGSAKLPKPPAPARGGAGAAPGHSQGGRQCGRAALPPPREVAAVPWPSPGAAPRPACRAVRGGPRAAALPPRTRRCAAYRAAPPARRAARAPGQG